MLEEHRRHELKQLQDIRERIASRERLQGGYLGEDFLGRPPAGPDKEGPPDPGILPGQQIADRIANHE